MQLPVAMEAAINKGKVHVRVVYRSDIIQGCVPWKSQFSRTNDLHYEQSATDSAMKSDVVVSRDPLLDAKCCQGSHFSCSFAIK